MNSTTPLLELLKAFRDSPKLCWVAKGQYQTAVASFQLSLDHPATIGDLNTEAIDNWATLGIVLTATRRGRAPIGTRLADTTIKSRRKRLRTLWRFAAGIGALPVGPPTMKRKWIPRKQPAEPAPVEERTPNISPEQLLLGYFDATWVPAKREEGIMAASIDVIRQSIRWFAASLKREPTLADLNDEALSKLWRFIRKTGRAPMTAHWNCARLKTIWRFAWKRGDVAAGKPTIAALKKVAPPWKGRARVPTVKGKLRGIPPLEQPRGPLAPASLATTLREFATRHYTQSHEIQQSSLDKGYLCAVSSFERFLKRPPTIADLNADAINPWLTYELASSSLRRVTVASYRRTILVLWRYCYEIGVIGEYPRRVKPIRQPGRIIEGYDAEQMALLLETADALPGVYRRNGIEKRLWWTAFLLTAWATGLRLGDLLSIERDWIKTGDDGSGRLSLVMHKTGNVIHRVLPAIAVAAVDRLMGSGDKRALCFPWLCRRDYFREFKQIALDAGLPGTTKWIRRGSASEVEHLTAGAGRYHLGHRSATMFDMAYRVDRIVGQNVPQPPQPQFVPTLRLTVERKEGVA